MRNEIILVITLIVEFGGVVAAQRFLGKAGLYVWIVVATILQNIEVLILVDAFGMEMTLGNILFASTFLATDILSELYGKEWAQKAVKLGIAASLIFLCIAYSWLLYLPTPNDFASESIRRIFSYTPRLVLASISVYIIVQFLDIFLYHRLWKLTERRSGSTEGFLWLRNNGATLISQLVNSVLYVLFAFYGIYEMETLISIMISTYAILVVTSLVDTPFLYLARKLNSKTAGS